MMDIEKLIEDLHNLLKQYGEKIPYGELVGAPWPYSRAGDLVWSDPEPYFIEQAVTALSTLQAENKSLKEKLYDGEGVNLVDYWMQQAKIEENGHRNCQAENERRRAELERCKENNAGLALALLTECAPNPDCLGDDEWKALRTELEHVKQERDAAILFAQCYTEKVDNSCTVCRHRFNEIGAPLKKRCENCGLTGTPECGWEFDFNWDLKED